MKKSIGLTANISEFRPNLPQTKHLNYFMGTNPVYMAGGGDVKAGIPNYPDVNVTRGFLPAALGFDNGGEASNWDFIKNLLKQFDNDFVKLLNFLQNILNYSKEDAENIVSKITGEERIAPKADEVWPTDTVTPKDTGKAPERIAPKADEVWPTVPEQRIAPKADEVWPPQNGGITSITPDEQKIAPKADEVWPPADADEELPFYLKPFDFNKDGKITREDLDTAKKFGYDWAIKPILDYLGLTEEEIKPDEPEKIEPEKIEPEKIEPEKIEPEKIEPEGIIPKIKPKPEPDAPIGGITSIDKDYAGKGLTTTEDEALGQDEQALFKATTGDTKGKKDVPAWALPLMSAGFAMMASKSPYFMQALGEGGQKGLETYSALEEGKLTKRKTEAEAAQAEAMAEYYGGGKGKGTPIVIGGKYYYKDQTPFMIEKDGKFIHATATVSKADIHKQLMSGTSGLSMEYQQLVGKSEKTQQDIDRINEIISNSMAIVNENSLIASSQIPSDEKEDGSWIKEGGKWIWKEAKELLGINKGGIVSLRR